MVKNIIIVEQNIESIKNIINLFVNKIENQNIKTFVATSKHEIKELEQSNDISLILINKNLNYTYHSENNLPIFYYQR